MGSSAHFHNSAPMQPPSPQLTDAGVPYRGMWFDGYGIRTPEMDQMFRAPGPALPPLPWIYRDPQRWLLPILAIAGLIIVAIATNGY